jgi:hypothetical protein
MRGAINMMKQFTTMRIAKAANTDSEVDSQHLTFKYWSKGDKHRIYIVDYKRRTLGYIDLDNGNAVEISDRQGNTQAEIDYAIAAFMSSVTDSDDNTQDAAAEQATAADTAKAERIKAAFIERIKKNVKTARVDEAIALVNVKTDAAWWIEHREIFELYKTGKAMRFVQTGEEPEEYVSNSPHAFN